jgi:Ca-activated chloride channel family protein
VKEYRLLGFDNPQNAIADSNTELEGGEVGSGHALMAVFEIVPTEKNLASITKPGKDIASLTVNYKTSSKKDVEESITFNAPLNFSEISEADSCFGFASSVIMFGAIIKESKFLKDVSWEDVQTIALNSTRSNDLLQKEFLELIEKAKKIYPRKKKK